MESTAESAENILPEAPDELFFIRLPAEFRPSFEGGHWDPEILLPLETAALPPGTVHFGKGGALTKAAGRKILEDLSWEKIISGILKLLCREPAHEHSRYYRELVLALRPSLPGELEQMAKVKTQAKNWALAEEILLSLCGLFPGEARGFFCLARMYREHGIFFKERKEEAREEALRKKASLTFHKALGMEDPPEELYYESAVFFYEIGDFSEARHCFESFLRLGTRPDHRETAERFLRSIEHQKLLSGTYRSACDKIRKGEIDAGLKDAESFLRESPQSAEGWFLLASALRQKERFKEADQAYEQAQNRGINTGVLLNGRAVCCLETGETDRAEKLLTKALRLSPEDPQTLANLVTLMLKKNQPDKAAGFLRVLRELEPENPVIRQNSSLLRDETG